MAPAPSLIRSLTLFAPLAAAARFPVHSWRTLPVFLHTSSQSQRVFSPLDLAVAARYPAVTIEKWMGCSSPSAPTQEDATLATAAAIRALNPTASIFIWYDSLRIYSHPPLNPDIINLANQSCVRNAHTPFLEAHRAYLLPNVSGLPALESYIRAHVYDHRSALVRRYWSDACTNLTATGLIDGCGADASQQEGSYILGLSPAVSDAWTAAHVEAVASATAAVSAQGGVILGKVGQQLGVSTNGVLQEKCDASNTTINTLREAASAAVRDGRRYLFECHSDDAEDDSIAAFLIGAGPDQFFGTGPWVTWAGGLKWLPVYDRPLGAPLADAVYATATATWTRKFASGTQVTFDVKTQKGTIAWGA